MLNGKFSVSDVELIEKEEGGEVGSPYFSFLWSWFSLYDRRWEFIKCVMEEHLLVTRRKQTSWSKCYLIFLHHKDHRPVLVIEISGSRFIFFTNTQTLPPITVSTNGVHLLLLSLLLWIRGLELVFPTVIELLHITMRYFLFLG